MNELDCLSQKFRHGAISRRELIGRAAALGVAAAMIPALTGESWALAADVPKKGGLLRLGMAGGGPSDSLDPRTYMDSVMIAVGRGLFSGLVELSADGRPGPELAANWEAQGSAAEWVFNLRKGVKFSNGREFTADDAIYSLKIGRAHV